MDVLEQNSLGNIGAKPAVHLRYIDDILIVREHGQVVLENFVAALNNAHDAIKFT